MSELKVGDRVKHGESVIRGKRDGTVEALGETKYGKYVQVKWDHLPDGTESRCLPYLVAKADDTTGNPKPLTPHNV